MCVREYFFILSLSLSDIIFKKHTLTRISRSFKHFIIHIMCVRILSLYELQMNE